jgi:hypothetical protein
MELVLDILRRCRKLLFDLQPIWVSRDNPFLLKADAISKGIDTDNWSILESDFEQLSILAGPFLVDLFATRESAKCSKFYTRSWERGCSGVDSFAQSWAGYCAFADPPCIVGHAYNQEDRCDGHEWRPSDPALEERKVLDVRLQGQGPFK